MWQCIKCDRQFDDSVTPTLAFNFIEPSSLDTFYYMIPQHLMNFAKAMTIFKKPVLFCHDCVVGEKTKV